MTTTTSIFLTLSAIASSTPGAAIEQVSVTATRSERSVQEQAVSLAIVDSNSLQISAPVHPSQALAAVPGTWISRGNGQESLIAIRSPVLTGAGSCGAFAIVEEGVPVRGTGFCNVNQLFDLNTEQAGRVEVLRGPGSVLYGSDALHGVINILSRAPRTSEDNLALETGPDDFWRIKIDHSRKGSDSGYRVSFNGARDGGYKEDAGYDQQKLTLRHDTYGDRVRAQTLLNINNLNQETAGYVSGHDAYKDASRKRENPNPEAFRDSRALRLQSKLEIATAGGNQWVVTPYARYTDMAFLMHFLPGTPLEENGQRGIGVQSAYQYHAGEYVALISGLDLEYTEAWLKQSQEGGFSSFPAGKQYDYGVTAGVAAAFTNAEIDLAEGTSLSAGARVESLTYDYRNQMHSGDTAEDGSVCINGFTGAEGCRYTRPDSRDDQFNNLSFNASLRQQLSAGLSGVARLARGFRAPQATELYRLQNGQMVADLDSESVESIELGLRAIGGGLRWGITGFYMEKSDVIFQSSERLNLSDGATRHYGVEYDLDWQLGEDWDIAIAGTFARHLYANNVSEPGSGALIGTRGNDIDTAPRRQHNVTLGWTPRDGTRVALQWQSLGRYYTDIENAHDYSGHDLVDLRWRERLSERVSLGLRARNLMNVDYAERADYSSLGGGERYFIGEPRSIYGDIRVVF